MNIRTNPFNRIRIMAAMMCGTHHSQQPRPIAPHPTYEEVTMALNRHPYMSDEYKEVLRRGGIADQFMGQITSTGRLQLDECAPMPQQHDFYRQIAARQFNISPQEVTDEQRKLVKLDYYRRAYTPLAIAGWNEAASISSQQMLRLKERT